MLDIREEIVYRKVEHKENIEMRPGMLVESLFIHVLGSMISMALCFYLIYFMMKKNQTAPRDPEKVPFLQERFTQVQKL